MAKHLIITTVGTSIFTNYQKDEVRDAYDSPPPPIDIKKWEQKNLSARKYGTPHANLSNEENILSTHWLKGIRLSYGEWIQESDVPNPHVSAEITSILKITEKLRAQDEEAKVEVQLLATDTALSVSAAKLIERYAFPEGVWVRHFNEKTHFTEGLQVNRDDFERLGLRNLIQQLDEMVSGSGLLPENCCLNITGGYKGVIPHVTLYGQVKGIPIYYIFENSEHLIQIPQAPLSINWAMFAQHYSSLAELRENGTENWERFRNEHLLFDNFDLCIWHDPLDGSAMLNGLGEFFLSKFERYRFIEVLSNGPLVRAKPSIRNQLRKGLEGLFEHLDTLFLNNKGVDNQEAATGLVHQAGGDILDHAGKQGRDWFISKYPQSSPEVRILYSFDFINSKIGKIKVWDFRVGGFNHSSYIKEFEAFVHGNQDGEWVPFLQVYSDS